MAQSNLFSLVQRTWESERWASVRSQTFPSFAGLTPVTSCHHVSSLLCSNSNSYSPNLCNLHAKHCAHSCTKTWRHRGFRRHPSSIALQIPNTCKASFGNENVGTFETNALQMKETNSETSLEGHRISDLS